MTTYSPKLYWKTFAALVVLLAITWSVGYVDLGQFNLIFALGIAIAKAILIMLFFMHIRGSSRLLHFVAAAGVLWLLILLSLVLGDYMTR
jgi:cytochrome c oxidase subunit 4